MVCCLLNYKDGIIARHVVAGPQAVSCSDVYDEALSEASAKGIYATKSNIEVCQRSTDAIMIAVKPHIVVDICKDIMNTKSGGSNNALIISLAAGVTLETLESNLPGRRVVRVMPNTACMVGQSASGYALGKECIAEQDGIIVESIFGSVGIAYEMKEVLLNAVTGLSGSGPAYVFAFIEALADGGVRVGLPRHEALQLAAQTVKGAAEMVLKTGIHPATLKDRVCSPGGTTIAGVDELEQGCVSNLFHDQKQHHRVSTRGCWFRALGDWFCSHWSRGVYNQCSTLTVFFFCLLSLLLFFWIVNRY
jgi:pyrroline-5-carboxylate reductase